jgi:hypothetical protein
MKPLFTRLSTIGSSLSGSPSGLNENESVPRLKTPVGAALS